ncbi:hypothetical protein KAR48_16080 [bacterium]|nr:hypothetical protein [bacterium]
MKIIYNIWILFFLSFVSISSGANDFELSISDIAITGNNLDVKLKLRRTSTNWTSLGSSNFVIKYNQNISNPTLISAHNFSGANYDNINLKNISVATEQALSINIHLFVPDAGTNLVLNEWVDIVTIRFTIDNPNALSLLEFDYERTTIWDHSQTVEMDKSSGSMESRSIYPTASIIAKLKVFLEGPYNTSTHEMNTLLNIQSYIPPCSPYAEDARTVASIPANIVDWGLLELRETASGPAVMSKSVFLRKDGYLVGDDGTTTDLSLNAPVGNYYVVIKHRNHLAVMSANAITLNSTLATLYDFATGEGQYYGSLAILLESGVYGMLSGDITGDGAIVFSAELTEIRADNLAAGYYGSDLNLDGAVVFSAELTTVRKNNLNGSALLN